MDLILINGESAGFSRRVRDGDRVSVYPVFESIDISPVARVRPEPLREVRFVLDTHLGKLATYLRMLGFDALYRNSFSDDALTEVSVKERRILLTRDRGLLKRGRITHGYFVRSTGLRAQLTEVLRRFDLYRLVSPFCRCLRCNRQLEPVPKEEVEERLPPKVREYFAEFRWRKMEGGSEVYPSRLSRPYQTAAREVRTEPTASRGTSGRLPCICQSVGERAFAPQPPSVGSDRPVFVVVASWPIQTEMGNRTRALASAALASSVWLVCTKRPETARPGWDNRVLEGMREKIHTRLREFWDAGIRGHQLLQALIKPTPPSSDERPLLESISNHIAAR